MLDGTKTFTTNGFFLQIDETATGIALAILNYRPETTIQLSISAGRGRTIKHVELLCADTQISRDVLTLSTREGERTTPRYYISGTFDRIPDYLDGFDSNTIDVSFSSDDSVEGSGIVLVIYHR